MSPTHNIRYLWFFAALILLVSSLSACNREKEKEVPTEIPALTVTVAGLDTGEIPVTAEPNQWNGAQFDRVDTLSSYREAHWEGAEALPLVPLGSTIQLEWAGTPPDEVVLYDYLLDENGYQKYTSKETLLTDVELGEDGIGRFILGEHYAVYLSSNSADYLPGATLRGYLLVCTWGENQCEYAFALRSDAY